MMQRLRLCAAVLVTLAGSATALHIPVWLRSPRPRHKSMLFSRACMARTSSSLIPVTFCWGRACACCVCGRVCAMCVCAARVWCVRVDGCAHRGRVAGGGFGCVCGQKTAQSASPLGLRALAHGSNLALRGLLRRPCPSFVSPTFAEIDPHPNTRTHRYLPAMRCSPCDLVLF